MPDIEISEDQRAALQALQDRLAAHVGAYGTVRPRDALQFLLDYHEAGGDLDAGAPTVDEAAAPVGGATDEAATDAGEAAADASEAGAAATDAGEPAAGGDDTTAAGDEATDDDERLEAMLNLLSAHDDKWSESDSDEGGKYVVDLPDGKTMHVRTKDEVRALLFRHYR